jgi:FkbM family methyltransferase
MSKILFIRPHLLIHVGADRGQGRVAYLKLGVKRIVWLEADPVNVQYLKKTYSSDQIISGIVSNKDINQKPFYLMNNTALSSSISPIDISSPAFNKLIFVESHKLDSVIEIHENEKAMLVIDVQGAEEDVLNGAQKVLSKSKYVVIEVALSSMGYTYQPSYETILEKLSSYGLKPSITRISRDKSYNDVLFIRGSYMHLFWIKWLDKIFDITMRTRHLVRKKHFPRFHYFCETCGK